MKEILEEHDKLEENSSPKEGEDSKLSEHERIIQSHVLMVSKFSRPRPVLDDQKNGPTSPSIVSYFTRKEKDETNGDDTLIKEISVLRSTHGPIPEDRISTLNTTQTTAGSEESSTSDEDSESSTSSKENIGNDASLTSEQEHKMIMKLKNGSDWVNPKKHCCWCGNYGKECHNIKYGNYLEKSVKRLIEMYQKEGKKPNVKQVKFEYHSQYFHLAEFEEHKHIPDIPLEPFMATCLPTCMEQGSYKNVLNWCN